MKYSVRGNLSIEDEIEVVEMLNEYTLWRLVTKRTEVFLSDDIEEERFTFEVWLSAIEDKDSLFNSLKPIVDLYGELIDWHECTHDEEISKPCVIAEEYRGE